MEEELIGIREAARRIGVSDTAVHKAIKSGRIIVAKRNEKNDRPLLAWPQCREDWLNNSDNSKRTHAGGEKARQKSVAAAPLPLANSAAEPDVIEPQQPVRGPSLAQSKALREAYMARLAKLEYDQKSGKLVDVDDVKIAWYRHITAAKTRIMGVPSACKARYSDLPLSVIVIIEQVCREALEDLADGGG